MNSLASIWPALKILECTVEQTQREAIDNPWLASNYRDASGETTSCAVDHQKWDRVIIAGTPCARDKTGECRTLVLVL